MTARRRVLLLAPVLLLAATSIACVYNLPFMGQFAPAPEQQIVVVTVPVLITTTPGPVQVIVVTATPPPPGLPTPGQAESGALPPTAENAQVAIIAVRDAGTVTSELVEIRNAGTAVVDLSGWKLRDADGNEYLFPDQRRMFGGGSVSLFSRVGDDTAIALFWDRQQPAFTRGDVITLYDSQGRAQSTFTVP
jgi:hypothetical protein